MNLTGLSWFNLGLLLVDLAIVAVLIPTVLLQRRESGATLAWIMTTYCYPLSDSWPFGCSAPLGCVCAAGVRVFELNHAMTHAKTVTIDG